MGVRMNVHSQSERHSRVLELPEMISGLLVLVVLLWQFCFERLASSGVERAEFLRGSGLMLCCLVWFNSAVVLVHFLAEVCRRYWPSRFLWLQLLVGGANSGILAGAVLHAINPAWLLLVVFLCVAMGIFALVNFASYRNARRNSAAARAATWWTPSVTFFCYMMALVLLSTLILLTPGATHQPISFVDALFTCASATSITGLMTVNVAESFTALGKLVILFDIQVGAVGVVTFSYFVLLMLGKRLAVRNSTTMSGVLDLQNANVVPALLKAVFGITLLAETAGAVTLYFLWRGNPAIPQGHLAEYAVFHAVSAFCNAGITLFPDGMEHAGVARSYAVQGVMMAMMLFGTLGFGVYLEALTRLKHRLAGKRLAPRWSTNSWLVVRVTAIVLLVGVVGMTLLSLYEPSVHARDVEYNVWEAAWNAVSRSGGFGLTDIDGYGPVYKMFLICMMFVGGNPAGTGGGVFAPVFALCVLEVYRVLRGAQDVEMHGRRIARSTVERAMSTVVLSFFWIIGTTMLILLLEPQIAASAEGPLRVLFMEVSAYTTTGFDLGAVTQISAASKVVVILNMLFGRVGMFTFMLLFIRQKPASPIRYPETRLPLN